MSNPTKQETLGGSINNPVTDFMDEMISRGASDLVLQSKSSAVFLVAGLIRKNPGAEDIDMDELFEDMAALGIDMSTENYGTYLHWSEDREEVYKMRFNIAFEKRNSLPIVVFHYEETLQKTEMDQGLLT